MSRIIEIQYRFSEGRGGMGGDGSSHDLPKETALSAYQTYQPLPMYEGREGMGASGDNHGITKEHGLEVAELHQTDYKKNPFQDPREIIFKEVFKD